MKKPITVRDALTILDGSVHTTHPQAFHVVFCTADKRRKTGGERIVLERAVLLKARTTVAVKGKGQNRSTRQKRYPIDVKNLTSGEIRHINIDLIEELNGHPVL